MISKSEASSNNILRRTYYVAALSAIMAIERKGDEILAKLDSIEKRLNERDTADNAGS